MLKSGIIEASKHELNTKVIYESERHEIIADKIVAAFDVGDMAKLYSMEKVQFDISDCIWFPPEDISCTIVGQKNNKFVILYPKGYLVLKRISEVDRGTKEFKWRIGLTEDKKHFYEIWRSK